MSKLLIAVVCGMLALAGAACQNRENDDMSSSGSSAGEVKAAKDDCAHCTGVQTAKADGTCPMCGMKVKNTGT